MRQAFSAFVTATAAALLAAWPSQPACSQELLANPGFEQWAGSRPQGWRQYGGSSLCTLSRSEDAHSGRAAVLLDDHGPEERDGRWSIGVYQELPTQEGHIYVASVWAKCLSRNHPGAVRLQITFLPSNKSHGVWLDGKIGGGWQQFSIAAAAPPGTEKLRLYIYTIHYWQSKTIIDDASLTSLDKNAAGDLYPALAWGTVGVRQVRKLNLLTPLVRAGQPAAVIVAPQSDAVIAQARRIQAAIEKATSVRLPIVAPSRQLVRETRTLIALGNLNNNAVIERLYWNKYLKIDALNPGPGAYDIRIVFEPYNWPRGTNIVVIGASDAVGLENAVAHFIQLIQARARPGELSFSGPLVQVSNARPLTEAQKKEILARPISRDPLKDFWQAAQQYRDTGQMVYAQRAKNCLLHCVKRFNNNPSDFITWPEETTSYMIGAMWDVVEELPIFSDRDRLQITNMLICVMHNLRGHVSGFGIWHNADRITWNHTTFPLLGIYYIARYIQRYYGDPDGKIAPLMAEVRGAFMGQVKSWKPQEDADSYMILTPTHTIDYTLAEGDYTYFENGNVRRWAEYVTGWCDNAGRNGGFGDSGFANAPVHERLALPWALWYYKDGRYLWRLQQVYGDRWPNPYDPTVRPRQWKELAGLTIFPLHPEVYRYAQKWPFYGEPLNPPNVPLNKCFDKIVFRGGLDKGDQYLLLDGFASGKHLHYDGNCINEFVDMGVRWLVDHDYLVRNTTEHNMITIARRGRCASREPVCAALESHSEFPNCALVHTAVYDWNAADWHRYLFWLKGIGFICLDRCIARQADTYQFEAVWKMLDEGEFSLRDGRLDLVRRLGPRTGNWRVRKVRAPAPGVAEAIEFFDNDSQMEFAVDLPAGKYGLVIIAKGTGTGANSFWVQIDGGEKIAFHTPVGRFGRSSSSWDGSKPTPTISISTSGRHRITVTMREGPPQYIDRFEFYDAAGKLVRKIEAESAQLPADMAHRKRPAIRFHIHTNGAGALRMSRRVNNVRFKLAYLHQRFAGRFARGQGFVFHTLFYADGDTTPRPLTLSACGENWARIDRAGRPYAFAQFGSAPGPLPIHADAALVYGNRLYVNNCSSIAGFKLPRPASSLCIDLATGAVSAPIKPKTSTMPPETIPAATLSKLKAAVAKAFALPGRRPTAPQSPQASTAKALWRVPPKQVDGLSYRIAGIVPADLNGDGSKEVIVLRGPEAVCLSSAGKPLWTFSAPDDLTCAAVADIDADGAPEVLVGCWDTNIYILDRRGRQLRREQMDAQLSIGLSSVSRPVPANIVAARLKPNGPLRIVVGLKNAVIVCYDASFKKLWHFSRVEHGTRQIILHDIDGDGTKEIFAANRYGSVEIFAADGRQIGNAYSELGDVVEAVGRFRADGPPIIANGSSTGTLVVYRWPLARLFEFDNFGYAVSALLFDDWLPASPGNELLVASRSGAVFVLDDAGHAKATYYLPDAVLDAKLIGHMLVAACGDGRWYAISRGGAVARSGRVADEEAAQFIATAGSPNRPMMIVAGEFSLAAFPAP